MNLSQICGEKGRDWRGVVQGKGLTALLGKKYKLKIQSQITLWGRKQS